jgi:hypothetical protein
MQVSLERESPRVIKVRLSGRVDSRQWRAALDDVVELLETGGPASILVAADGFEGWEPGNWEDLSFQRAYDPQIRRMAIVADKEWEDRALMFSGKGLRKVDIEFFTTPQMPQAMNWLTSVS